MSGLLKQQYKLKKELDSKVRKLFGNNKNGCVSKYNDISNVCKCRYTRMARFIHSALCTYNGRNHT